MIAVISVLVCGQGWLLKYMNCCQPVESLTLRHINANVGEWSVRVKAVAKYFAGCTR